MYNQNLLKDILIRDDYRVVNEDGNLLVSSHEVYKKISASMEEGGSKMSPIHVFTTLNENRHGFRDYVLSHFLPHLDQSEDDDKNEQNDESYENCEDFSVRGKVSLSENFKLVLSAAKWELIKPIETNPGQKMTLRKNKWTDVMADCIFEQTKLPCAFSFKKSVVCNSSSAKFHVKVQGNCNECRASLIGYSYRKPIKSNEDIIFHFNISNCQRNLLHLNRRHLRGERRKEIARDMIVQRKAACIVRNEMSSNKMEFGDPIPPTVCSSDVLRKAKQECFDELLGLSSAKPIDSLILLKHTSHQHIIRTIGADPFYCVYFSPEQIHLHKILAEHDPNLVLTVDASGGFVYKILYPISDKVDSNNVDKMRSNYCFLYVIKSISTLCNVSLYQMISSKHDAGFLTYFFTQVLTVTGKIPVKFVTDFSKALLIALARSYASCRDLKHYLQICYRKLVANETVDLPRCCLSLDVNHFIAQIARWKCLKGPHRSVRQFYLRSLAQIYQMTNFNNVRNALQSLIIVALSPEIGFNDPTKTFVADNHLQYLNNLIRGDTAFAKLLQESDINEKDEPEEDESDTLESICDVPHDSSSDWISWSKNVYSEAEKIAATSTSDSLINLNPFYTPSAALKIKELAYWIPLWTGIMNEHFNIDGEVTRSSATIEAEFSKLKNYVFDRLPLRADRFVASHTKYLEGEIKLARAKLSEIKDVNQKKNTRRSKTDRELCESLANEENWKKKNNDIQLSTEDTSFSPNNSKIYNSSLVTLADENSSPKNNSLPSDKSLQTTSCEESNCNSCMSLSAMVNLLESAGELSKTQPQKGVVPHVDVRAIEKTYSHKKTDLRNERKRSQCDNSQNETTTKKTRTYLSALPEWDCTINSRLGIPIMKNANSCETFKDGRKRVKLSNTCAFDSIFFLVMQGMHLFPNFKVLLEKSDNKMGRLAMMIMEDGNLKSHHYVKRYELLKSLTLFENQIEESKISFFLDCDSNAAHLSEHLFQDLPYSCVVTKECRECGHNIIKNNIHVPTDLQILFSQGTGRVQAAIDEVRVHSIKGTCSRCNCTLSLKREYGPFLLIDTSIDEKINFDITNGTNTLALEMLDKQIKINDHIYSLVGAVHYIPGHYQAYYFNGLNWHRHDDIDQSRKTCMPHMVIKPHVLLYVRKN